MTAIHAFVVFCLSLNPTMCRELEITPWDYRAITSITDCAMGGMIFGAGGIVDLDGAEWKIKGIRCRAEGEMPTTDIQARLRASVQ